MVVTTKTRAQSGSLVILTLSTRELVNARLSRDPMVGPVVLQQRPQHLIHVLASVADRAAKNPLLHGAQLPQRAVRASVLQQHARLETMRADRAERERRDQPRGF